jgi:hypothetical protein
MGQERKSLPGANLELIKLAEDKVDPGIGRTRLGHRTLKCVLTIGTRSAHSIMASGFTAAQTGRTHDRTRPMLQQRLKSSCQGAVHT